MDKNKNNKNKKRLNMKDMATMVDDEYFDHIILNLDELLLSTEITSSDHLKKLSEMLLDSTRTDHRICNELSNGSLSAAENNTLFLKKTIHSTSKKEDKYYKHWRLYSLHIQQIMEERDLFTHFRILLSIKCLLNEKYLTKYQFIASGIIDILLYYLTVTDNENDIKSKKV